MAQHVPGSADYQCLCCRFFHNGICKGLLEYKPRHCKLHFLPDREAQETLKGILQHDKR